MILNQQPGAPPPDQLSAEDRYFIRLNTGQTPTRQIVQRKRKLAHPPSTAQYRSRRNRFLQRVARAWTSNNPDSGGSFTALAAAIDPWTNWYGMSIHPTPYTAWQIFWVTLSALCLRGQFDPFNNPNAPNPWPLDWRAPIDWNTPTWNWGTSPPEVTLQHSSTIPTQSSPRLIAYLAPPSHRADLDPTNPELLFWTAPCGLKSFTSTSRTWYVPNYDDIYPYALPHTPTLMAVRPDEGNSYEAAGDYWFIERPSDKLFYIMNPNPSL